MSKYYILKNELNDEHCSIRDLPEDFPNLYYPHDGIPMGSTFPKDLELEMDPNKPGIQIGDYIRNNLYYHIVNARLKKILEENATAEIEFLRFTLLNHKGRVASDECYIANVIGTVDCVDKTETIADDDPVNKGRFMSIEKLVLDEDKIDKHLNLFRIKEYPMALIVRDDLKTVFDKEQVTGVAYLETDADILLM